MFTTICNLFYLKVVSIILAVGHRCVNMCFSSCDVSIHDPINNAIINDYSLILISENQKQSLDKAKKEWERSHEDELVRYQKLLGDYNRLEQRYENVQEELQMYR